MVFASAYLALDDGLVGLDLLLLPMLLASIGYVPYYVIDRLVWGLGLALLDIARTW